MPKLSLPTRARDSVVFALGKRLLAQHKTDDGTIDLESALTAVRDLLDGMGLSASQQCAILALSGAMIGGQQFGGDVANAIELVGSDGEHNRH